MSNQKYIPISAFGTCSKFAIDPNRISVLESAYPGCIEVHLTNYKFDRMPTQAGGTGLVLAGSHSEIRDSGLSGNLALIAGFDEVFEVACNYDGVVVLRPLGVGLGYRSVLAARYLSMRSRKRRTQKKHASKAAKFSASHTDLVASLTGTLPGPARRNEGPYYLLERTQRWQRATPIKATTLHQARLAARVRIAQLTKNGWKCGQEDSRRGELGWTTEATVAWICKKHGPNKWVSVECGELPEVKADEWAFPENRRGEFTMTAAQITDACKTWAMFNGFSGEHCGHCLTDQNVLAGGPGFVCPTCGHHNVQSFSHHQMPHEFPEFGPTAAVIHAGIERYRKDIGELREDGTEVPFGERLRRRA